MKDKIALFVGLGISVSACVDIKVPENIVSDTVKAGKGIYHDVKDDKKEAAPSGVRFSFTYSGQAGENAEVAKKKCVDGLESGAKEKFGQPNLAYRLIKEEAVTNGDKVIANCSLEVI